MYRPGIAGTKAKSNKDINLKKGGKLPTRVLRGGGFLLQLQLGTERGDGQKFSSKSWEIASKLPDSGQ